MANRFAKRIREGELDSVESLKSAFKSLAKASHPDLAGPGSDGAEFARLRTEYEDALRDFERHRFSARSRRGSSDPGPGPESGRAGLAEGAWPRLSLLLKRGFPKSPRHRKETLRYEYARWRFEEALGSAAREAFRRCERELLELRIARSPALGLALGLVRALAEYETIGLAAMRTELVLALGRLKGGDALGPGFLAFVRILAEDLGIGVEIG
jgi:hypothetical protein